VSLSTCSHVAHRWVASAPTVQGSSADAPNRVRHVPRSFVHWDLLPALLPVLKRPAVWATPKSAAPSPEVAQRPSGSSILARDEGVAMQNASPPDLGSALLASKSEVTQLSQRLAARDADGVKSALLGLVTSATTGVPALGALVDIGAREVFANTATKRLLQEAARFDADDERCAERELDAEATAARVEVLLGQALIQIVQSQHRLSEESRAALSRDLGGVNEQLRGFREDFVKELSRFRDRSAAPPTPCHHDSGASAAVVVRAMKVQAGGVGVVDEASEALQRGTPLVRIDSLDVLSGAVGLRIRATSQNLAWIGEMKVAGEGIQRK
jgi:hypothetical protein